MIAQEACSGLKHIVYLWSQSGNGLFVDRSSPIKNLCSTGLLLDWTGPDQKSGLSSTSSTEFASWEVDDGQPYIMPRKKNTVICLIEVPGAIARLNLIP